MAGAPRSPRPTARPRVVLLAGPNGAGKTTCAARFLRDTLAVAELVNADTIAHGLSAFAPDRVALAAGRALLARLRELASRRSSLAIETTLASRSLRPWLVELARRGYDVHMVFLWLTDADLAVRRVAERVRGGGHDVPEVTIRRRYRRGLRNFFALYRPLSSSWRVYDNSSPQGPQLVARGQGESTTVILHDRWDRIRAVGNG